MSTIKSLKNESKARKPNRINFSISFNLYYEKSGLKI